MTLVITLNVASPLYKFLFYAFPAIRQAFLATSEAQRREKLPVLSCEHCPMVWYHKLCAEVEGEDVMGSCSS